MTESFFVPNEVCTILRIKLRKFYSLVRSGQLRAIRVGREFRVSSKDLDSYLEEQKQRGTKMVF